MLRKLMLILAQALGQLVHALFGVVDQQAAIARRGFGVGGDDLHLHDALGGVVADLDHVRVEIEGFLVRSVVREALDRIDEGLAEILDLARALSGGLRSSL